MEKVKQETILDELSFMITKIYPKKVSDDFLKIVYTPEYMKIIQGEKYACNPNHCMRFAFKHNLRKHRTHHICDPNMIIYAFLKSFLDTKYVLLDHHDNVLLTMYQLYGRPHILYVTNNGFGIYGSQFSGFADYYEDPVICATIINLIHAYYNKKKNPYMIHNIKNFPYELIKSTTETLIKMELVENQIIENEQDCLKLCRSMNFRTHAYASINEHRVILAELFLSLILCDWFIDRRNYSSDTFTTTLNVIIDNELTKNKIIFEEGMTLEHNGSEYPSFIRGIFSIYLNVLVKIL
jgi:hypothetical protein